MSFYVISVIRQIVACQSNEPRPLFDDCANGKLVYFPIWCARTESVFIIDGTALQMVMLKVWIKVGVIDNQ